MVEALPQEVQDDLIDLLQSEYEDLVRAQERSYKRIIRTGINPWQPSPDGRPLPHVRRAFRKKSRRHIAATSEALDVGHRKLEPGSAATDEALPSKERNSLAALPAPTKLPSPKSVASRDKGEVRSQPAAPSLNSTAKDPMPAQTVDADHVLQVHPCLRCLGFGGAAAASAAHEHRRAQAAAVLQAGVRGKSARIAVTQEVQRAQAATVLQARTRGRSARLAVQGGIRGLAVDPRTEGESASWWWKCFCEEDSDEEFGSPVTGHQQRAQAATALQAHTLGKPERMAVQGQMRAAAAGQQRDGEPMPWWRCLGNDACDDEVERDGGGSHANGDDEDDATDGTPVYMPLLVVSKVPAKSLVAETTMLSPAATVREQLQIDDAEERAIRASVASESESDGCCTPASAFGTLLRNICDPPPRERSYNEDEALMIAELRSMRQLVTMAPREEAPTGDPRYDAFDEEVDSLQAILNSARKVSESARDEAIATLNAWSTPTERAKAQELPVAFDVKLNKVSLHSALSVQQAGAEGKYKLRFLATLDDQTPRSPAVPGMPVGMKVAHPHYWESENGHVLWCQDGDRTGWGISYQGQHLYFGGGHAYLPTHLPQTARQPASPVVPILVPVYSEAELANTREDTRLLTGRTRALMTTSQDAELEELRRIKSQAGTDQMQSAQPQEWAEYYETALSQVKSIDWAEIATKVSRAIAALQETALGVYLRQVDSSIKRQASDYANRKLLEMLVQLRRLQHRLWTSSVQRVEIVRAELIGLWRRAIEWVRHGGTQDIALHNQVGERLSSLTAEYRSSVAQSRTTIRR